MYRHHPQTRRLAELVRGGRRRRDRFDPRDVLRSRCRRASYDVSPSSTVARSWTSAATASAARGSPAASRRRVTAHQIVGPSGVDVRLAGTLVFPGDVVAQIDCAFDLPLQQSLEIVGAEGSLRVASPWSCERPAIEVRRGTRDRTGRDRGRRPLPAAVRQLQPRGPGARGAAAGPRRTRSGRRGRSPRCTARPSSAASRPRSSNGRRPPSRAAFSGWRNARNIPIHTSGARSAGGCRAPRVHRSSSSRCCSRSARSSPEPLPGSSFSGRTAPRRGAPSSAPRTRTAPSSTTSAPSRAAIPVRAAAAASR